MIRDLIVRNQTIHVDREATLAFYRDRITGGDADRCNCRSCRNFAVQRSLVYPEQFVLLLHELGADPEKEWEAFDYDVQISPGHYLYGGWFVFSGEIVEGAENRPQSGPFSYWFTTSFPGGEFLHEIDACAVEFSVEVPWHPPGSAAAE